MTIQFYFTTYGAYGGGLKSPFRYFNNYIGDYFNAKGFVSTVEELEITFAYPPYRLPKTLDKDYKDKKSAFFEWLDALPDSRFSKKRCKFSITLPFPELSEFLDKNHENSDIFEYVEQSIDAKYKNKSNEEILGLLYEKMIYVFEYLHIKLKKEDSFDARTAVKYINVLKKQTAVDELPQIEKKYALIYRAKILSRNQKDRDERAESDTDKTRLIIDVRFYYHFDGIGHKYFMPYSTYLCDAILEQLRKLKFRCPRYNHLYVSVSDTFENALYAAVRYEPWFVYGLAVLENPMEYQSQTEHEKKKTVFNLIKTGLLDIAKIDQLDRNILNTVLDNVEKTEGLFEK